MLLYEARVPWALISLPCLECVFPSPVLSRSNPSFQTCLLLGASSDPRLGYRLPPAPPAPYFSLCYDTDHTAVPPSADRTPRAGPRLPSAPQPPSLNPNGLAAFWAGPNSRAGGCLTWPGALSGLPLGPSLWAQARGGVCWDADSDVILGSPWAQQALGPQAY